MTTRVVHALVLLLLVAGAAVLPGAMASADDEVDTTAPQVQLNPCFEGTGCRLVRAAVHGDLEPGDDLAVLGARIGDQVLAEHVFDDGSGFVPYGPYWPYGSDVGFLVDYALSVEVPRGSSDITFYARDLEGNSSELTTTVLGPVPPGPVRRLTARLSGHRTAQVSWGPASRAGSCCVRYTVRTPGRAPRSYASLPPSFGLPGFTYRSLTPGWHRFTVRASTEGGTGPARSVRLFVPRRHAG